MDWKKQKQKHEACVGKSNPIICNKKLKSVAQKCEEHEMEHLGWIQLVVHFWQPPA